MRMHTSSSPQQGHRSTTALPPSTGMDDYQDKYLCSSWQRERSCMLWMPTDLVHLRVYF